jgi:glycosyltransferase involved in cell wall biosynthesis
VRGRRPIRLIVLGEGPHRYRLEELARELGIAEDVHLPGFVKNPYAYLRDAALFALSSDFEGFAVVLIEALACGCPVVATDCPSGPSEILEEGCWGSLVSVGDVGELASAIQIALRYPPHLREHLRQRAEAFSAPLFAENYLDVINA